MSGDWSGDVPLGKHGPRDAERKGKFLSTDLWRLYGHRVTWLEELDDEFKQSYLKVCVCVCVWVDTSLYTHLSIQSGWTKTKAI